MANHLLSSDSRVLVGVCVVNPLDGQYVLLQFDKLH